MGVFVTVLCSIVVGANMSSLQVILFNNIDNAYNSTLWDSLLYIKFQAFTKGY